MSRYVATTKDDHSMSFGYDRPLQEYFVQVYDEADDLVLDKNSSGQSMLPGQSGKPSNNSEIYALIKELMHPQDWLRWYELVSNILLDLPF